VAMRGRSDSSGAATAMARTLVATSCGSHAVTGMMGCRAYRHSTTRLTVCRAVPGPRCRHSGTIRHGTATPPCLTVPCLAVPCFTVPVPCRAWAAHLDNYILLLIFLVHWSIPTLLALPNQPLPLPAH